MMPQLSPVCINFPYIFSENNRSSRPEGLFLEARLLQHDCSYCSAPRGTQAAAHHLLLLMMSGTAVHQGILHEQATNISLAFHDLLLTLLRWRLW